MGTPQVDNPDGGVPPAWNGHNPEIVDEVAAFASADIDLVDELERILRGEPVELEVALPAESVGLAEEDDPFATARSVDPYPEDDDLAPLPYPAAESFYFAGHSEPALTAAPTFLREERTVWDGARRERRRVPRSDLVIISLLVLLVAGAGAYAMLRPPQTATALIPPATPEVADASVPRAVQIADTTAGLPVVVAEGGGAARTNTPPAPATAADPPAGASEPAAGNGQQLTMAFINPPDQSLPQTAGQHTVQTLEITNKAAETPAAPGGAATEPAESAPVESAATTPPPAPAPTPQASTQPAAPVSTDGTTTATARTWVNMRSGPDNGAAVLLVVPSGAEVHVKDCNFWCEVIYDGRTGWIYQDFLTGI